MGKEKKIRGSEGEERGVGGIEGVREKKGGRGGGNVPLTLFGFKSVPHLKLKCVTNFI